MPVTQHNQKKKWFETKHVFGSASKSINRQSKNKKKTLNYIAVEILFSTNFFQVCIEKISDISAIYILVSFR